MKLFWAIHAELRGLSLMYTPPIKKGIIVVLQYVLIMTKISPLS